MNQHLNEILMDKLSLIAYCSAIVGDPYNALEHTMRATEKAIWAREALQEFKSIDLDQEEPIYSEIHAQLVYISKMTNQYKQTTEENTCLNYSAIWYEQIKIGRDSYQSLKNFIKSNRIEK